MDIESIIRLESIIDLNKLFGEEVAKHPWVGVVDFSKVNFSTLANLKVSASYYTVLQKNLSPGALRYGRNYYDLGSGTLLFIAPDQVITIEDPDEHKDVYGWGLLFHPELLRRTSLNPKMKEFRFFSYDIHEALHVSEEEKSKLDEIIEGIEAEVSQKIDRHNKRLIVSYIELLLNYCDRCYDRQFITRQETSKGVISDFKKLLIESFTVEGLREKGFPSVKDFAEQLHLSSNYLSDLLKKETGRNGTEHIQNHVIDLAKDNLLSTSASISQIAYGLGFEYPQYFSRMFKKKTGMTPAEYRNLD